MTDKEELILALKCCLESLTECAGQRCPYYYNVGNCIMELKKNSLRFLEEETEEERPRWIPVEEKLPDKEGRYLEVQHASDDLFLNIYLDSPPGSCLICWFCYPDFRPERKSSHCCDRVKMPVRVADGIPEWCPLRKENKNA